MQRSVLCSPEMLATSGRHLTLFHGKGDMKVKQARKQLKVEGQVGFDEKFYHRVELEPKDWQHIYQASDALKADPNFNLDPIIVVRWTGGEQSHMLLDGLYRLRIYHAAGRDRIPATVLTGLPRSQWFAHGVEMQMRYQFHKNLTAGDKAFIALKLTKEQGWSLAKAAQLLRATQPAVQRMLAGKAIPLTASQAIPLRVGYSKRTIGTQDFGFLKGPVRGANGTKAHALAALAAQDSVAAMDPIQILDSFIALLKSGCVDMTDQDVAQRVLEIKQLLP